MLKILLFIFNIKAGDVVAKNNLGKRSRNKCVVVVVVASVVEPKPESL